MNYPLLLLLLLLGKQEKEEGGRRSRLGFHRRRWCSGMRMGGLIRGFPCFEEGGREEGYVNR